MSRGQFEELVDRLSAALLTVDFGSLPSLERALANLEDIDAFLRDQQRDISLGGTSTETLSALRTVIASRKPSNKQVDAIRQELEALTQYWYDHAKDWERPIPPAGVAQNRRPLVLSDAADPALLAEFIANTRLTGDDLETHIQSLKTGALDAIEPIRRIIHTLKGEAGMLGINELATVLHATETYLEVPSPVWERGEELLRVRDWMMDALVDYEAGWLSSAPVDQVLGALAEASQRHVRENTLHAIAPSTPPSTPSLKTSTSKKRGGTAKQPPLPSLLESAPPPPSVPTIWDDQELELVVEFLHESQESVSAVDQTLLEIEREGPDAERINKLFRAFHTLKGVASFLHLSQIVELSHTTETMLDSVRSGKLVAETGVIDLVFDSTTLLRTLLSAVQTALDRHAPLEKVAGIGALVAKIKATTNGEIPPGSALPAKPGNKLGEILLDNGAISEQQLSEALVQQRETGRRLGEELISSGTVPAKVVAQALRGQSNSTHQSTKAREIVKVDLERVDQLVETIGELVIVESMVSNAQEIRALPGHLRNYLGQFAKITRELQELGMRMRMVPLRSEFQKMARMVRDLTRRSNKQVRVELRGENTEMDRSMVEQIADPLVHLIRNAVDHGIESPADRAAAGKQETGLIVLSATHEAGSIVVKISDDGKGIDRDRVVKKAISQGLIAEGANLTDSQVYDLLFMPGFSTAAQVTEISGRGVGMDVVKRNIEAVRGRIITTSAPGKGTTFRLVLPLTLAIIDGMVIRCGSERFIVPTLNIIESLQPTEDMLFNLAGRHEHILVRGQTLPLIRLGQILDIPDTELESDQGTHPDCRVDARPGRVPRRRGDHETPSRHQNPRNRARGKSPLCRCGNSLQRQSGSHPQH
ncbi:MAG: Hpt domain-containing protein [Anaeromyxobacter sp.]